jgi:peptidoglycan/LPS O-acetylase OafA/YrhL
MRDKQNTIRLDVQGLRAVAVLSVMLFHVNKAWLPGGFVGVDVFFVISGYIISNIILTKREAGNYSIIEFYINRIKRIIPAYLLMIIITIPVMAVLMI